MKQAFLYGVGYGAGFCLVIGVLVLSVITAVTVRDWVAARRCFRHMVREAVGSLDDEDIAALLRGDENTRE